MTIFDVLALIGGLCLFLFGMNVMGDSLERRAGGGLKLLLGKLTGNKFKAFLTGLGVTAVIQSSSATTVMVVGFVNSGIMTLKQSIGVIMGANIGTCVTAMISSVGANRNAKRAAVIHLSFNIIGTAVWLAVFSILSAILKPAILDASASYLGIAVAHSVFNILCTLLLLPMSSLLEKLALKLVPDAKQKETVAELDERLLVTPAIALDRCNALVCEMASESTESFTLGLDSLFSKDKLPRERIQELEDKTDHYEDIIGTYLIKLSRNQISDADSAMVSKLLKLIGDYERIADHSVNVLESAEELREKGIEFSAEARKEIEAMCSATREILELSRSAFIDGDLKAAYHIEPLEQVIDELKEHLRNQHILRLKDGTCTVEAGFIWADLLTDLERVADHCSNIAACVIDTAHNNMNLHQSVREMKEGTDFETLYGIYSKKYALI